ncbi:hypothetical protein L1987_45572 [Smallanthus sonchifolius]|uniref:Uncharacterized protein n=1 Tax=Smallanthus sonchifolius TaxID=185202 RepID=A0ACB9FYD3_9ASTR|nr:hypothetical protein L1987_45572 [Smallanthus sonchifolius]
MGKKFLFSNTIKEAFKHLINLLQNRPTELISKSLDEKPRGGNKGGSKEQLEVTLDKFYFRDYSGKISWLQVCFGTFYLLRELCVLQIAHLFLIQCCPPIISIICARCEEIKLFDF